MDALVLSALALALAAAAGPGDERPAPTTFTNSIGMTLVTIPPGEFWMGAPDSDRDANEDEQPRRRVRITRPFALGATEVTIGQFRRFVAATGYTTEAERDGLGGWGWDAEAGKPVGLDPKYTWRNTGWDQTDAHPVVNVTWEDAAAFCAWLSREEGRTYRLPTEAEWEYACRAGTTTRFWSGDDPEGLAAIGNIADGTARATLFPGWKEAIQARDGYVFTAPVGRFRANPFGLFDMHGNVWEWCSDWYDPAYPHTSPPDDPRGPAETVGNPSRVVRGGGWSSVPAYVRASNRPGRTPDARYHSIGFRVAVTP